MGRCRVKRNSWFPLYSIFDKKCLFSSNWRTHTSSSSIKSDCWCQKGSSPPPTTWSSCEPPWHRPIFRLLPLHLSQQVPSSPPEKRHSFLFGLALLSRCSWTRCERNEMEVLTSHKFLAHRQQENCPKAHPTKQEQTRYLSKKKVTQP